MRFTFVAESHKNKTVNAKILQLGLALILVLTATNAQAQMGGDLDESFGESGYALPDFVENSGEVYIDMITLSDDKIVMVGYTDTDNQNVIVSKMQANGLPDKNFGENGTVQIDLGEGMNDEAFGVAELSDGKLLVTGVVTSKGSWDGFIMRLTVDGKLDESFGMKGSGITLFNAGDESIAIGREIVVQNDNIIFVGGSAMFSKQLDMCVFKFTQGGGVAASFATKGVASVDINGDDDEVHAMALTPNGEIILAGASDSEDIQHGAIVKLSSFGTPTTFAETGHLTFDLGSGFNEINDLYVDEEGRFVAVGNEGEAPNINGVIMRVNSDGSMDATFGDDGIQSSDPGTTTSMYLMNAFPVANGGILTTGYTSGLTHKVYAYMMTESGTPNGEFAKNGNVSHELKTTPKTLSGRCAAIQEDGSILIGGNFTSKGYSENNLFAVRLLPVQGKPESVGRLQSKKINLFPNPATSGFSIEIDETVNVVELVSMQGQVMATWYGQKNCTIPAHVMKGNYLVKVQGSEFIAVSHLMVTR